MTMIISNVVDGIRVHLATEISEHKIFASTQMWKTLIKHVIEHKIAEARKLDP